MGKIEKARCTKCKGNTFNLTIQFQHYHDEDSQLILECANETCKHKISLKVPSIQVEKKFIGLMRACQK